MNRKIQLSVWHVLLAALVVLSIQNHLGSATAKLAYSDFKELLQAGKIEDVALSDTDIVGTVRTEGIETLLLRETVEMLKSGGESSRRFSTVRLDDPQLVAQLRLQTSALWGARRTAGSCPFSRRYCGSRSSSGSGSSQRAA